MTSNTIVKSKWIESSSPVFLTLIGIVFLITSVLVFPTLADAEPITNNRGKCLDVHKPDINSNGGNLIYISY